MDENQKTVPLQTSGEPQKIVPVEISDEMKKSFLEYSMSVIVSRALPDVRDGLKPVHRRILYTMYENSLTPDKAYRKCADTVGAVLGRYHPHGDASVYDALVRMAQDFSLRYMLVDGHGNFGSVDGYPAAAYRYTEARMSKLSVEMLDDIEKDTVSFSSNYDDRLKEPDVLPSRFPNLLVNGSSGIAVGMATNIPPHNLGEIIDGMCCLIDNPGAELEDLCQHIKGPDFPTGALIMGRSGIRAAYATGRGRIVVRAKTEIEELANGRYRIVASEIPYMVNKRQLVKAMMDLVNDKRIEGVDDVVDYSSREGIRIVVDLKRGANPQVVLNKFFSYTQLQTTFGVIMLALVNGQPKVLTLKEMLQEYINHQCVIVTKRTEFDLRKAQERAHILEGLRIALDFIDEVIAILRSSKSVQEGKDRLIERFGLDDVQASAIVAMRLGQLTGLEREKIEEELAALTAKIDEYSAILADPQKVLEIIKTEALNIRDKYVDERRTEITAVTGEVDIEDLIPEEESVLTLTNMGYIKRLPSDTYKIQRRGGRGISGLTRREEDFAEYMFVCSSHAYVLFFTSRGRVFRLKAYEIPEGGRTAKGMNIVNLLQLEGDEKVTAMLHMSDFEAGKYFCMVTRRGIIKRIEQTKFVNVRKSGLIALDLDEGDELRWVRKTTGGDELLVATKKGMAIRFHETGARPLGRQARGVRAIRLREGDEIVGMSVLREGGTLLTVTETGYGRRSPIDNYRVQSRGGKGITNYRVARFGDVAAVKVVDEDDDVIMIADDGVVIRIAVSQIGIVSRPGKGVRVMRVEDDRKLVTLARSPHEEDDEDEEAVTAELPEDDGDANEGVEEDGEVLDEEDEAEPEEDAEDGVSGDEEV
ncbi:MAG: DNA gyrase subunit A [Oscillospiraceae bacterium]|jgi:DNA gyrase subunit A|nr:DNA gyrase subunit A [Oscillospiraceae bacterium]